jgi:hypothetical protein
MAWIIGMRCHAADLDVQHRAEVCHGLPAQDPECQIHIVRRPSIARVRTFCPALSDQVHVPCVEARAAIGQLTLNLLI